MKSQQEMETIMNLTYPGLRLLYRDVNLSVARGKYAPNMVLRDGRELDASLCGGGLLTTHRYAILSNRIVVDTETEPGRLLGLCVIPAGAYFKVLDIYRKLGKTQITLLHLPEAHWRFFQDVSTNVDDLLVEYARNRFDACIGLDPVPQLNTPEWRRRCCHPIGLTDLGVPLPLTDAE